MTKEPCPNCKGEGVIRGFGCPGFRPVEIPCLVCKGEKVVGQEVLEWRRVGEEMRQERIARGVTLREEAKRRGMSAVDLSGMEHGAVKPVRVSQGRKVADE